MDGMNNNQGNEKKCPKCGAPVAENSLFCGECGAKLSDQNTESNQNQQTQNQSQFRENPGYQNQYGAPPMYNQNYNDSFNYQKQPEKLSVGDYILMLILFQIPLVGFIMMLVWSFGDFGINRKNFARAFLIIQIIAVVLVIILSAVFGIALSNLGMYLGNELSLF